MSSEKELTTLPVAPLKLIVMQSCAELGKKLMTTSYNSAAKLTASTRKA